MLKNVYDFKSTYNKKDLISLIRSKTDYKIKDLDFLNKKQLFRMWCKIDFKGRK